MLQSLHVKNLALINEAEVEFTNGLNILSGETGAGKSIIIGSLNLALGEKVPKEMVRENAEYALVELIFRLENEKEENALKMLDIFPEDGEIILSRKIVKGRSVAKINAETVPASKLKEAAACLIDIHGQHEHESLLSKKKHLEILDVYAKEELELPKEKLKEAYRSYKKLREELSGASLDEEERKRELSFLEFEVNEIEAADLRPGEDEELEADYKRLLNGQKILSALHTAYEETGEGMDAASEQIGRALREIMAVGEFDEKVSSLSGELAEIESLLNDFNREISDYISDADFDEETFAKIQKRLDEVNHIKEKYGKTIENVEALLSEKKDRIQKLYDYDTYLSGLKKRLALQEEAVKKYCGQVSGIRKRFAKKLSRQIQETLKDLNFLDVSFEMHFDQMEQYTSGGWDDAQFLISTNPGESLKPLGKVASGGELSRVMLAIKTVLADQDFIGTLVFDEIDAGISGRTAQMVSEKMNVLGKNHQIICITHLPQIAAMADGHFLIEKSVVKKSTISTIRKLEEEETVKELARMIGGVKITDTVLKSAQEMKELAAAAKRSMR